MSDEEDKFLIDPVEVKRVTDLISNLFIEHEVSVEVALAALWVMYDSGSQEMGISIAAESDDVVN